MALIGRLFVILLGYFAASLAAGAIMIAFELQGWIEMVGLNQALIRLIAYGFIYTSSALLLPALVVIAITEALHIRSLLAYVVLGALALVFYAWFTNMIQLLPATHFRDSVVAAVASGAGVVAGIVYGSIAGRNAGLWRKSPLQPSQAPSGA
jgi:hypothetical protein